jgi:inner membrane protein involved in colicin E2 resistance
MFFSVKTPTKIAGKVYTPCVCYPLPDVLKPTIDKMVEEGKAYIYNNKVFFQNGKVIEKKEEPKPVVEKKQKKVKKEEEMPSPEEIADNVEDF